MQEHNKRVFENRSIHSIQIKEYFIEYFCKLRLHYRIYRKGKSRDVKYKIRTIFELTLPKRHATIEELNLLLQDIEGILKPLKRKWRMHGVFLNTA